MKKIFHLLAVAAAVVLCFSACQKEGASGQVNYTFGISESHLYDQGLTELKAIDEVYVAEFKKISGASDFNSSGTSFTMNGKYSDTDSKVLAACKAAESTCSSKGLTITGGYAILKVSAVYYNGGDLKDVYTSKTYGTKD